MVRDFLLANSATIIQDDFGIPLANYDPKKWRFFPFGHYAGPIEEFPGRYQPQYAELFRRSQPMGFGIGYRWRSHELNLLLSVKLPSDDPGKLKPPSHRPNSASASSAGVPAGLARRGPFRPEVSYGSGARPRAAQRIGLKLQRGATGSSRRIDAAPSAESPRQIPSRARRSCERHVVDPRCPPGLAAQQPRQGHPSSAPQPKALDRLVGIGRTGRQVPAVVANQRREGVPVNPDQRAPGIARQALHRAGAVGTGQ